MSNRAIDRMLNKRPDLSEVKTVFYSYFELMNHLGPVHTLAVCDFDSFIDSTEEMLAFALLCALWGRNDALSETLDKTDIVVPLSFADDAWDWVLDYLKKEWGELPAGTPERLGEPSPVAKKAAEGAVKA